MSRQHQTARGQRRASRDGRFAWRLAAHVDGGSLAVVRIAVGLVAAVTAVALLVAADRPAQWHFAYPGFSWLPPWPRNGVAVVAAVLAAAGVWLASGWRHRAAAVTVLLAWCCVFLTDPAYYRDQHYLLAILALLLAFVPAGNRYSLARRSWEPAGFGQADPACCVPWWSIVLLRGQMLVVYVFSGLALLSSEWLLDAEPLHVMLRDPRRMYVLESLLSSDRLSALRQATATLGFATFLSYAYLMFYLAIGFLLIARRTRMFGVSLVVAFLVVDGCVLPDRDGWLRALPLAATTVFFEPDWPARLARWVRRPRMVAPEANWFWTGAIVVPVLGALLGWKLPGGDSDTRAARPVAAPILVLLAAWFAVQALVPLRHVVIPGQVGWTREGDLFSWRTGAALKFAQSPLFIVVDDTLVRRGTGGQPDVDWSAWSGRRAVYQNVDGSNVALNELPEFIRVFQPLVGERVMYNPWMADAARVRSADEATERATHLWQQLNGRPPRLATATSLEVTLARVESMLGAERAPEPLMALAARARFIGRQAQSEGLSRQQQSARLAALQDVLRRLTQDAEFGWAVRSALAGATPFALQGGPQLPVLLVDDPAYYEQGADGLSRAARAVPGDDGNPPVVLIDFRMLSPLDWHGLPKTLVMQQPGGHIDLVWNQHAELLPAQYGVMSTTPQLCRQYARHIASEWLVAYGRRPAVRTNSIASQVPHAYQVQIDPQADLAGVPYHVLRHNAWIAHRIH